jgi:DtxR family Mn-dependent transcriptional regulator
MISVAIESPAAPEGSGDTNIDLGSPAAQAIWVV